MNRSDNQLAQTEGDTSANAARRIRDREKAVAEVWRNIAYYEGERACTTHRIAAVTGLPMHYVRQQCERTGYALAEDLPLSFRLALRGGRAWSPGDLEFRSAADAEAHAASLTVNADQTIHVEEYRFHATRWQWVTGPALARWLS